MFRIGKHEIECENLIYYLHAKDSRENNLYPFVAEVPQNTVFQKNI